MDKRLAVALRYDSSAPAPFVVASGRGELARRLIHLAQRFGVPVGTDEQLAESLVDLPPNSLIPPHVYGPVAAILALVMQIEQVQATVE